MTTDVNSVTEIAKAEVSAIFSVMGIRKVVIIDDAFSASPEIENLIASCLAISNSDETVKLRSHEYLRGIDFDVGDQDVLAIDLRKAISDLDANKRQVLGAFLTDLSDGNIDFESDSRNQLESILEPYSPQFLSLSDWKSKKNELLSTASISETLFLFDQDMSHGGGGEQEGIQIIAELLGTQTQPQLFCALLTHTVQPDYEYEKIESLSQEHRLEEHKDRLVVISKGHLQKDLRAFAFRLKRVAVAPKCRQLKMAVGLVIEQAIQEAKKSIESLNVYDFEQIVFQSSYLEGIWEPDTLIRLFNLFHRCKARELAVSNTDIIKAAEAIRNVVEIPYKPADAPKSSSTAIRRLEFFEKGDYINSHHLPIELGDIFQKGTSNKNLYVLIGQPCDLMVRSEGKRSGCKEAILAEICAKRNAMNEMWFELPCFNQDDHTSSWVKFRDTVAVPLMVLDLAVFNKAGECKVSLADINPGVLSQSWKKRLVVLKADYQNFFDRFERFTSSLKGPKTNEALGNIQRSFLGGGDFASPSFDLMGKEVKFNLKRVGRLREPLASSMLRRYSLYLSRDAFEHDFTTEMHAFSATNR